jgi:hypothetical protein
MHRMITKSLWRQLNQAKIRDHEVVNQTHEVQLYQCENQEVVTLLCVCNDKDLQMLKLTYELAKYMMVLTWKNDSIGSPICRSDEAL